MPSSLRTTHVRIHSHFLALHKVEASNQIFCAPCCILISPPLTRLQKHFFSCFAEFSFEQCRASFPAFLLQHWIQPAQNGPRVGKNFKFVLLLCSLCGGRIFTFKFCRLCLTFHPHRVVPAFHLDANFPKLFISLHSLENFPRFFWPLCLLSSLLLLFLTSDAHPCPGALWKILSTLP